MRRRGRRYVAEVLVATALAMGLVWAANYVVDPYQLNSRFEVERVNRVKPRRGGHDRLVLPVWVAQRQPRTLLLGSSRVLRGLNERHPALAADGPVMMAAFPGATIHEIASLFEHAVSVAPVRRAVVGLDFFAFSAATPPSPAFDAGRFRRLGDWPTPKQLMQGTPLDPAYFTVSMLRDSLATVAAQPGPARPAAAPPAGGDKVAPAAAPPAGGDKVSPTAVSSVRPKFRAMVKDYLTNPVMDGHFAFGSDDPLTSPGMQEFRRLLATARRAGVELKLFISPAHASLLVALERSGRMGDFERWKRSLVQVLAEERGAPPIELTDFSGPSPYSMEAVPVIGDMRWYIDAAHYGPALGDVVLDMLHDRRPPGENGFGRGLAVATVEDALARDRAALAEWQAASRAEIEALFAP